MPSSSFSTVTKVFHWLTAVLIFALFVLGVLASDAPFDTDAELAQKALLFSWHKTLGVTVFFVALGRILWALTHPKPAPLHPDRRTEVLLAETVHWLLYGSLVIVPLSGWISHAATEGFAPIWWPFGQSLPFVPKSHSVEVLFGGLHWISGKVMMASVLLHALGAIKHHVIDRDATLRRMWFGKVTGSVAASPAHRQHALPAFFAALLLSAAFAGGAFAGLFSSSDTQPTTALAQVNSDWQVQTGDIAITVTQFGSPVTGRFADWTAAISFDPEATDVMGNVDVTIAIGSLTLGSVKDQAMGPDFFDTATFPTAQFAADITAMGDGYVATGTLTIKDQSVPVTLPFTLDIIDGTATMAGNLALDRLDFGVGTKMPDETNLGFAVDVTVNLTATR